MAKYRIRALLNTSSAARQAASVRHRRAGFRTPSEDHAGAPLGRGDQRRAAADRADRDGILFHVAAGAIPDRRRSRQRRRSAAGPVSGGKILEGQSAGPLAGHGHREFRAERGTGRGRQGRPCRRAPRSRLPEKRTGGRGVCGETILCCSRRANRSMRRPTSKTKKPMPAEDRKHRKPCGQARRGCRTRAGQYRFAESHPQAIRHCARQR